MNFDEIKAALFTAWAEFVMAIRPPKGIDVGNEIDNSPAMPSSFPPAIGPYFAALQAAADANGVPVSLLAALSWWESGAAMTGRYDPGVRQRGGLGRGLFQIDSGQHPEIPDSIAFDPALSAFWAADELAKRRVQFLDRSNARGIDPWDAALAAYNGGPRHVEEAFRDGKPVGWHTQPIDALTGLGLYVEKVNRYRDAFAAGGNVA